MSACFCVSKLSPWPREEGEHHYPSWIFKAVGEREGVQKRKGNVFAHGWGKGWQLQDGQGQRKTASSRNALNIIISSELPFHEDMLHISEFLSEHAGCGHHLVGSQRGSGWTVKESTFPLCYIFNKPKHARNYFPLNVHISFQNDSFPCIIHFAHSSSRIIKNIPILMQVICLTLLLWCLHGQWYGSGSGRRVCMLEIGLAVEVFHMFVATVVGKHLVLVRYLWWQSTRSSSWPSLRTSYYKDSSLWCETVTGQGCRSGRGQNIQGTRYPQWPLLLL